MQTTKYFNDIHNDDVLKFEPYKTTKLILKPKARVSTIMKFFNAQTIAVTVFLLMYCAAGKTLWLYLGVLSCGGVTYTRWGHNACPSVSGTQMLYTGRMSGVFFNQKGGGANYLCLPNDPEYDTINTSRSSYESKIYGTEYRYPVAGSHDHNVPCAVCHATTRAAKVMIPARTSCPPNWTREYYGYLQSENNGYDRQPTEYICVDKDQVYFPTTHKGALLYHVRASCVGIECPPYNTDQVLTCTVWHSNYKTLQYFKV